LYLSSTCPAVSATLFRDDFSDKTLGPVVSAPGGWIPVWNGTTDFANNAWVRIPTDNGTVLQAYGAHSGCWGSDIMHPVALPADLATPVFVKFTMTASGDIDSSWPSVCGENRYDIGARLTTSSSNWSNPANLLVVAVGQQVHDGNEYFDNTVAIRPNVPAYVVVRVNRATGMKTYWLNGRYWDMTFDNNLIAQGPSLAYVSFTSGGGKGWIARPELFTDELPPVTYLTKYGTVGENGWLRSAATVSISAADGNSFVDYSEYSFDGTSWDRPSGPLVIAAEGSTTLRYRSMDVAGNLEATKTDTIKIDTIAPAAPAIIPASGATGVATTVTVTATYGEAIFKGANAAAIELYDVKRKRKVAATTSTAGAVLSIKASAALASRAQYRVTIPAGAVKDIAGNPNAEPISWYFTTK
jgi:hypothetical protein